MSFVGRNKDDDELELKEMSGAALEYHPRLASLKFRNSLRDRYGKSGSIPIGDKKVSARPISFNWTQASENEDDYRNYINYLVGFFDELKSPFFLIDKKYSIRSQIVLNEIVDDPQNAGLYNIVGANRISFTMLDPFYEDEIEQEYSSPTGGLGTGEIININNDGFRIAYPVFEFETNQSNPDFAIVNETNKTSFVLGSNNFGLGTKFIVDSVNGEIFLDNGTTKVESSVSLADGSGFINFSRGINTIKYISDFGDIIVLIKFRRRYGK